MKRALVIFAAVPGVVLVGGCGDFLGSFNRPLDAGYDPLDSPGQGREGEEVAGPLYTPGTWVEVTDYTAAFYGRAPTGSEQPQRALPRGTPLKVVGSAGTYVKVETEGGEIGYVPSVMVGARRSATEIPIIPGAGGGSSPMIDPVDPGGPDLGDGGFVAPEPEVPPISVEEAAAPAAPGVPPETPGPDEEEASEQPQPPGGAREPALPPDPLEPEGGPLEGE